jgi:hypothetical protein
MHQRKGKYNRALWLLAPLLVLVLLSTSTTRTVGWVLFRLLAVGGAVGGVYLWASRRSMAELLRTRDDLTDEEAACKERLERLTQHSKQVENTLGELRNVFRRPLERLRVEQSRSGLEATLRDLRSAMARERAVLYSIEATRWQRQVEPLLRELEWIEDDFEAVDPLTLEQWVQTRLDRVNELRPVAVRLQARLRTDTEACGFPSGQSLLKLLRHELAELELLRADLLTMRAELVAYNRPWEASQPDPEFTVQKLKALFQRIRARRDGRLRPQRESTAALLQSRAALRGRTEAQQDTAPEITLQNGRASDGADPL